MTDFLFEYEKKTVKSKRAYESALKVLPEGIGGSAAPHKPYPFFVEKCRGSRVWDLDGNEYIDFDLCWGVLLVGHVHPLIVEELKAQIERGTMFGFPHRDSEKAANEIKRRFPVDKVRFVNSGTEATMYAVRLARAFTGKSKVVKVEGAYHGWEEELFISKRPPIEKAGPYRKPSRVPVGEGIPLETLENTVVAPFNDIDVMEKILEGNLGEVAAVIVEPVLMNSGVVPPKENYLQELRKLTEEHNALLVFDEVKTGARIAPGGACEYFKVKPDIVTLSKVIGGGLPLGAVAGRKEVMEQIDQGRVPLYGTYHANPLSVKACLVTLKEILTGKVYFRINRFGEELMKGYKDIVRDKRIKAQIQGIGSVGCILFTDRKVENYRDFCTADKEKWYRYWMEMVVKGVIPMPHGPEEEWSISVQHTEEDVEKHIEVFNEVSSTLKD